MSDPGLPMLTFPALQYGETETPWDLRPLLYRGGAATRIPDVAEAIENGQLGMPLMHRLPLVEGLHEHFTDQLAGGGSARTVKSTLAALRAFFSFCDASDLALTATSIEGTYIAYTEHLRHLIRSSKQIDASSAYGYATTVGNALDSALNRPFGLLFKSRITKPQKSKRVLGSQADKKNLEDTFAFGHALIDIADALTTQAIYSPLPVTIPLRSGHHLEEWSGLIPSDQVRTLTDNDVTPSQKLRSTKDRAAYESDLSQRTRYPLINLRVASEMMIFVAQTGMNLSQAQKVTAGKFRYQSYTGGYRVFRLYKGRRQGEVEFEIYSEYKPFFERYLRWRDAEFPDQPNGLLFQRVNAPGRRRGPIAQIEFSNVKRRMQHLGIPFVPASALRKTRVNWLLRRTGDPTATAEMAQHGQETLFGIYGQPHHQVAAVEISRFHVTTEEALAIPGPGVCVNAEPMAEQDIPPEAPRPDCISPAGCLFCEHQRDIKSQDHVWSLATYRHYKSLELAGYRLRPDAATPHPALAVITRITAKLKQFETLASEKASWVIEAQTRVEEGHYHPKWDGFIQLAELRT